MPQKYAILIDAGFLKKKLGSKQDPINATQIIDFVNKVLKHDMLIDKTLHRIYYYDSPPLNAKKSKPLTDNTQTYDFSKNKLYKSNLEILNTLKKQKYFAV